MQEIESRAFRGKFVTSSRVQATPEESFTSWILHHGKTYLDNVQVTFVLLIVP